MKKLIILLIALSMTSCCYLKDELTPDQVQEMKDQCDDYEVEYCGWFVPQVFGTATDVYCVEDRP